jgi:hypothetical protein
VLPLVLQIGPVQIEPVMRRLLRVRPGSDEPSVLDAIRRAGGTSGSRPPSCASSSPNSSER